MKRIILTGLIVLIGTSLSLAQGQGQKQDTQAYDEKFYSSYLIRQGFQLYQIGNYEEAISYFKEAYKTEPNNAELKKALGASYFQLAHQAYKKQEFSLAKKHFKTSLGYYPLFEVYQNLALVCLRLEEYDEAKNTAEQGLKIKPNSKELLLILAECFKEKQDRKGLLGVFERLYEYYPLDLEIALNLGMLYRMNMQANKAVELYQKLKQAYPQEKRIYSLLAEIHLGGYRYAKAREEYQEVLKYYPDDIELLSKIAGLYTKEKNYNLARQTYRDVLKLDTNNFDAYNGLSQTYIEEQNTTTAISIFEEARGKLPENLIVLKELGKLYESSGSLATAEGIYFKMIGIKADESYPYIKLGLLYEDNYQNLASATTYYKKACDFYAPTAIPYLRLANFYYKSDKDGKEALSYTKISIEKALRQIEEITANIFLNFGNMEEGGGGNIDFTQLMELSKASKELDEPKKLLKDSLSLLNQIRGEDKEKLLNDLEGLLQEHKRSEELLFQIGKLYQEMEKYSTAVVFWEKVVTVKSDNKEAQLNMALCQEKIGEDNKAELSYKRVIEIDNSCEQAYENLINIYKKQGRINELIEAWGKITRVKENPTMTRYLEEVKHQ